MDVKIEESWKQVLAGEFASDYFAKLVAFVKGAYAAGPVYPPGKLIFNAFNRTPFDKVKVVILGQDPYHEPGQAQGLAFYVPPTVQTPPSLVNIAKELATDCPSAEQSNNRTAEQSNSRTIEQSNNHLAIPDLLSWTDQGVLLLNATLTVKAHCAGSHQGKGWEQFTDAVVRALAERREHLVFILWGGYARRKGAFIDRARHCVIESAHPSPLSAYHGFFGSKPFSRTNDYLIRHGVAPIAW